MQVSNKIDNYADKTSDKFSDTISKVTAWLVTLLAILAFVLSYNALKEVAVTYGVPGWLSYVWPLLVDFALIVFSLAVLRANLREESTVWPWMLVGFFTALTITFNLLHAEAGFWNRFVASVAPIALFLSFETLMGMVRSSVKQPVTMTQNPSQIVIEKPEPQEDNDNTFYTVTQTEQTTVTKQLTVQDRRQMVLSLANDGVSPDDIARQLDVSIRTVYRDLDKLNGNVKVLAK